MEGRAVNIAGDDRIRAARMAVDQARKDLAECRMPENRWWFKSALEYAERALESLQPSEQAALEVSEMRAKAEAFDAGDES